MTAVSVRYIVDDVAAAVDFYTRHFGFEVQTNFPPAFADATRGNLRLLLSGPKSSAGRPMSDGEQPRPGGWNRIHLIVDDLEAEIDRLESEGVKFRNEVVSGRRSLRRPGPQRDARERDHSQTGRDGDDGRSTVHSLLLMRATFSVSSTDEFCCWPAS